MAIQPYQRPQTQGVMPQSMQGMPMGGATPPMPQPTPSPQMQGQPAQPPMGQQGEPQMPNNQDFENMSPAEQEQILSKIFQFMLAQRISQMSDEELEELDKIITPESVTILAKLLPEMIPIFESATSLSANGESGSEEGYAEDDEDGMNKNPLTEDDTEDKENPMMRGNPAVSQGLVR